MAEEQMTQVGEKFLFDCEGLQQLLDALLQRGYEVIGPRLQGNAIIYDTLSAISDLPVGWTDRQEAGHYRLEQRQDEALFGYVVGPQSWRRFLHPPVVRLWQATCDGDGFRIVEEERQTPRYAFLGVRPCDLRAIAIQDRIFLEGPYVDPIYQERRRDLFIVAVNCTEPGGTCFCASMGTGPDAKTGFDLALTEVVEAERHYFVAEVGTARGAEVLSDVSVHPASEEEVVATDRLVTAATMCMGRAMDIADIKALLYRNLEHPRWKEIANRCLTCGNCTLVCPTCFCSSVEDTTDLGGERAERRRLWDSCFTLDFSYIHGGSLRASTEARYRQWMVHKLGTWIDQFGVMGCMGCGRCITWCPVGIDITAEIQALRSTDAEASAPEGR